jgi:hypothetical protein
VAIVVVAYGTVLVGHKVIFPIESSTTPTIDPIEDDSFHFGVQFHEKESNMEEFMKTLAQQMANYQARAAELWPDNKVTDKYVIAECIESGELWLLSPEGEVKKLSKDEAQSYGFVSSAYSDAFSPFEGNGISGMYLAVSEEDLNNYLVFQKYLHLGTYDVFLTYAHELFHMTEQDDASKWAAPDSISNPERSAYYEEVDARAKRYLLQEQLAAAISDAGNREKLILDALATYKDYKEKFPNDYDMTTYFDRIEGTAYYFELKSALYAGYPEQVKNPEDLYNALGLLVTRADIYRAVGAISESYRVGAFASVLLDEVSDDGGAAWKKELMENAEVSPMDILEQRYAGKTLPEPQEMTSELKAEFAQKLEAAEKKGGPTGLFRMFYNLMF